MNSMETPSIKKDLVISMNDFMQLNIIELPEMIYVETRFITQSAGSKSQNSVNMSHDLLTPMADFSQLLTKSPLLSTKRTKGAQIPVLPPLQPQTPMLAPISLQMPLLTPIPSKAKAKPPDLAAPNAPCIQKTTDSPAIVNKTKNACIETEGPHPTRDRDQQTVSISTSSVGIQCCLESEQFWNGDTPEACLSNNPKQDREALFMNFVNEKSLEYTNGKWECLVCGEVASNKTILSKHLAKHWGPPALCSSCGYKMEHEQLLKNHCCDMRTDKPQIDTTQYRCPYFLCRVTAISRWELYDHINEHSAQSCYHCKGCKRNFTTASELKCHLPLQKSRCQKVINKIPYGSELQEAKRERLYRVRVHRVYSERRKRTYVKWFLSLRVRSKYLRSKNQTRCQICLKYCSNVYKYKLHSRRCVDNFLYRLKRSFV